MSAVEQKIIQYYADPANLADCTEKQDLFLEGMRQHGTVLKACEYADISRTLAYIWRQHDPVFRQRWDAAKEDANDKVKNSLFNMATSEKNVVATIYWLKNNCHDYRDRVTVDFAGAQREVEEQLDGVREKVVGDESLRLRLPSASAKDIVADALGLNRRTTSQSPAITVEPARNNGDDPR